MFLPTEKTKYLPGILIMNVVLRLAICFLPAGGMDPNLPLSREARLMEVSSPHEWLLEATGIADAFEEAVLDAKRAALWWSLFGERGILVTPEERQRAEPFLETLFEEKTLGSFITWTEPYPTYRSESRVALQLRINRKWLKTWLREKDVLTRKDPLEDLSLFVIPARETTTNLDKNVAESLENFATARGLKVYHSQQAQSIEGFMKSLMILENGPYEDTDFPGGAEAIITYRLSDENGYTVCVKILGMKRECSGCGTARMAWTGAEESIEKAAFTAMEELILCLERGTTEVSEDEYSRRIVTTLSREFPEMELDGITKGISELLSQTCRFSKEVILTDYTLDFRVVIDRRRFSSERRWYTSLKDGFMKRFPEAALVLLDVEEDTIFLHITPVKGGDEK